MAETVTINAQEFDVYATETQAANYLEGAITNAAGAFRDAEADTQKRALVSATRWLDDQTWKGEKAADGQALEWPRTGIEDVDDGSVPTKIVNATIELAALLVDDPEFRTTIEQVDAKRLKAGSVEIEYFRGGSVETTTVFPKRVMALVKQWLAGASSSYRGAASWGTSGTSLEQDYDFDEGI